MLFVYAINKNRHLNSYEHKNKQLNESELFQHLITANLFFNTKSHVKYNFIPPDKANVFFNTKTYVKYKLIPSPRQEEQVNHFFKQ